MKGGYLIIEELKHLETYKGLFEKILRTDKPLLIKKLIDSESRIYSNIITGYRDDKEVDEIIFNYDLPRVGDICCEIGSDGSVLIETI